MIDETAVKTLTAKTIGVDESQIAYKEISLKTADKKRKKHFEENISAETFKPIYKISCSANTVKYKLYIDAVSGNVLDIDVG